VRPVEFYFRETAAGIRRNGTVAFGAVSTAFIALFLFGLALLIRREISLVIEQITGNVQVAVYLEDTVHPDTITQLQSTLENPAGRGGGQRLLRGQGCDLRGGQGGLRGQPDDHRERAVLRVSDIAARDLERHQPVPTDHGVARVRSG
jgi:hypothetical protein